MLKPFQPKRDETPSSLKREASMREVWQKFFEESNADLPQEPVQHEDLFPNADNAAIPIDDTPTRPDDAAHNFVRVREAALQYYKTRVPNIATSHEILEGSETTRQKVRQFIEGEVIPYLKNEYAAGRLPSLAPHEYQAIADDIMDRQFGLGPVDALCRLEGVEDVFVNARMVNGQPKLYAFAMTKKERIAMPLDISVEEMIELIRRQIARQGKTLNPANPRVDATTMDGRRINAVVDPLVEGGLALTIRVPSLSVADIRKYVQLGTLTPSAASFLLMCVHASVSVLIAGGTGAGKTSMLNALSEAIDPESRVVCIEDTRELNIKVPNVVYMIVGAQNAESQQHYYTTRDLVANALRQRPNRIILGEVRDGAAWDAIKATNTGHPGTMLTIHADQGIGAAITRLYQLAREAPETAPIDEGVVLQSIVAAFRLGIYVQAMRTRDGRIVRFVRQIAECTGLSEGNRPAIVPLYEYDHSTKTLKRTMMRPSTEFYNYLAENGYTRDAVDSVLNNEHSDFYLRLLDELDRKRKALLTALESNVTP